MQAWGFGGCAAAVFFCAADTLGEAMRRYENAALKPLSRRPRQCQRLAENQWPGCCLVVCCSVTCRVSPLVLYLLLGWKAGLIGLHLGIAGHQMPLLLGRQLTALQAAPKCPVVATRPLQQREMQMVYEKHVAKSISRFCCALSRWCFDELGNA